MKLFKVLFTALFLFPLAARAASNDFMVAAQLLSAAKNADIQQVQALINNGADVNFTDSTGVSIVCTALMNNDVRAAQILQMYGADASSCDRQIKNYKARQTKSGSGGLFSGLSSAHSITLAAAGAAVVVGGLFLLTDVFDPDSGGSGSTGTGDRPGGDNSSSSGGSADPELTIPYGPAYLTIDGKISYSPAIYAAKLQEWDPTSDGVRAWDFNYFRPTEQPNNNYIVDGINVPMQNYLLMMHGYSSFANGYMGQNIFRDSVSRNPVVVSNTAGGGAPVIVSLISNDGVNPEGSLARGDGITYADSASATANTYTVDKFLNYASACVDGVCGGELSGLGASGSDGFDMTGSGTAMNPFASPNDTALGKIIAGWSSGGRGYGDLFGFVPNGRLGVIRTGNGKEWVNVEDPTAGAVQGTVSESATGVAGKIDAGDTITLGGKTYTLSLASALTAGAVRPVIEINGTKYYVADTSNLLLGKCSSEDSADCEGVSDIALYQGTDNFYYVNTTGGREVDAVYVLDGNNLYTQKTLQTADFKNYQAMSANRFNGTSVLANVAMLSESYQADYLTLGGLQALFSIAGTTDKKVVFQNQIDLYYDKNSDDVTTQGGYANSMFNSYSTSQPIIVNAAGAFEFGQGDGKSLTVLDATFENFAPALYNNNLEHMFMTVVAVSHTTGTSEAGSISGYGDGINGKFGPLYLSMWTDNMGTEDTSDDIVYSSRKCGIAGLGINGIDPWCFSAAGATSEMATASAAGAVAALKGAFGYMSNSQIFTLMALTADGYLLGSNDNGVAYNSDTLAAYLREMYSLPPEYDADTLTADLYLRAFAEVYGYGIINLERAMTPNKNIYFFDGNKIVSASGNAYWRAATSTVFKSSSALTPRVTSIRAPFYDVLSSVDGEITMPRIWQNEFTIGATDERGLYMGDTLAALRTRTDDAVQNKIGNMSFSMTRSARAYNDNLGGLDDLSMAFSTDKWDVSAGYQNYLTDGADRFSGLSNPVLGLARNAITSSVAYKYGNWSLGVRGVSGFITDEGLLENDPTLSAQFAPAHLGRVSGMQTGIARNGDKFGFNVSMGAMRETNTLLGAQTGGLLNMGAGDTTYVDSEFMYRPMQGVKLTARATFSRTRADANGAVILGLSDIDSNAYAIGADVGNFSFAMSRPLGVYAGDMWYAYADYAITDLGDGNFGLDVRDTHVEKLTLRPDVRELRFTGTYRHSFGEFTDGALGFIYRVNPNNTYEFGNETILMMKLSHRVGI